MTISRKVQSCIERSSWIRRMFEEGDGCARFTATEKSSISPSATPGGTAGGLPAELLRLAQHPLPGMHRYMNNAGYEETRAAVAEVLAENRASRWRPATWS